MADYRLSAQVIGRKAGRSATAAAAYRSASRIFDRRTGIVHDYSRKEGMLHSEILAPDNAPEWMRSRAQLWNAVEAVEKRKDAQLAREIQLSLPHELDHDQRTRLIRGFCQEQFVDRGMIADLCIHAPSSHEMADNRNFHAHVMLTMRTLMDDGFGKKDRDWNDTALLAEWREQWAEHQNRELKRLGFPDRVDHRSLEERGILREPQQHLGPIATEIERDGRKSHRGRENDEIKHRNSMRADLEHADNLIDAKIAFEKRKFDAWAERKREHLQIDEQKRQAQLQVGLAGRIKMLETELDKELGEQKGELARQHDYFSGRLQERGWRKWIRDITLTTSREKRELEKVEREQDTLRRAEEAKRAEFERREDDRKARITEEAKRKQESLETNIAKARARREEADWMPKPEIRHQVPKDWEEAGRKPLDQTFNEAANRSQKPVEGDQVESGGSDAADPFVDRRAAYIRQQRRLKDPHDHIGRAIAKHEVQQREDQEQQDFDEPIHEDPVSREDYIRQEREEADSPAPSQDNKPDRDR